MADCDNFIDDDFIFPMRPNNRPALPHFNYRIAAYPQFMQVMLKQIDSSWELRHWTHRDADDPGIALLQGAAIIADILTFYQQRYANEGFLRTAQWRESVADLVRLTGYRLSPGVGGNAGFAFELKGEKTVTIPAGFPLKTDLENLDDPAEFQTSTVLQAYPHLSKFNLYRKRNYSNYLYANKNEIELAAVDDDTSTQARSDFNLQSGDRLLLLPPEPAWTSSGSSLSATQLSSQVVKVKKVRNILDRTVVELETPLTRYWTLPVKAYRLGRSFRHFGHNAPPTYTVNTKDSSGKIDGAKEYNTKYVRHVDGGHACANTSSEINIPGDMIPLDQTPSDLLVKTQVIIETRIINNPETLTRKLVVVKTISNIRSTTMSFGGLNGPTALMTLDSSLVPSATFESDVRDYVIHEVIGAPLLLKAKPYVYNSSFSNGTLALNYFGNLQQVKTLAGRHLMLQHEDGRRMQLYCTQSEQDFFLPMGTVDEARMWPLSFDKAPSEFTRADFDETERTVTIYGNIAAATQGKQEKEVVLGNGDVRRRFQTFPIPKSPLTHHISSSATPPEVPELTVYVNGRTWTRVNSFFGQKPQAQIYIVREDKDGQSYIQFGDGETGARLPSGVKNISAVYRTGIGAFGALKSATTPTAGRRIVGLAKVHLPLDASGGAQAESADNARMAAPGKVQGLGRLVSLQDFETELLSIAGVSTVNAAWDDEGGIPTLILRVLLESGRDNEFESLREIINDYQRCRGADRFPISIQQAFHRFVYLDIQYGFDPVYRRDDVETGIRTALGLFADNGQTQPGLFGLYQRRLGEAEYAGRIEGVLQQEPGVLWCKVTAFGMFHPAWLEPEAIALPTIPRAMADSLWPSVVQILQLHEKHLTLTAAAAPQPEECD